MRARHEAQILTFASIALLSACEAGTDDFEERDAEFHEVYLAGEDGQRLTLGYYNAATQAFHQSPALETQDPSLEVEHANFLIETGDDSILVGPGLIGDRQVDVVLQFGAAYPVYAFGSDAADDSQRIGVAHVDPEPVEYEHADPFRYAYKSASWGWADVECITASSGVSCAGAVQDIKTDGYCVYMYYRPLTQSGWRYLRRSCGTESHWSRTWSSDYPSNTFFITRGPLSHYINYFTLWESLL